MGIRIRRNEGKSLFKTALLMLAFGLVLIVYTYIAFKRTHRSLKDLKQEDPVSYYLDFALNLLPAPFWALVVGVILLIAALVILLINLIRALPIFCCTALV